MRGLQITSGVLLSMLLTVSAGQDTLCNPCVDVPVMRDRPDSPLPIARELIELYDGQRTVRAGNAHISPLRVLELLRDNGGTLQNLTHECGTLVRENFAGVEWMISGCSWGGRYPALLVEPAEGNAAEVLYVLAVTGPSSFELLSEAGSAESVDIRTLLIENFQALYEKVHSDRDP